MTIKWVTAEFSFRYGLHIKGPEGDKAPIQFYGCFGSILSFENVATQLFAQVLNHLETVSLHDYRYTKHKPIDGFEHRSFSYQKATVGVFHGVVQNQLEEILKGHRYRIGVLVCDADIVPVETIETCEKTFDLIVVPSQFCKRVFRESGLKKDILVVPHGVTENFQPLDRPLPEEFTFYNVYSQMRPYRKSEEELIEAFAIAFDCDPNIKLQLRTKRTTALDELITKNSLEGVVEILEDDLNDKDYVEQFNKVHALVHPSKAEGFGMIPLQALACGVPVIATQNTGMSDYLSEDNAILLKVKGKVPAIGDAGEFAGGMYHGIDQEHLVRCLRDMHKNWQREKQKSERYSSIIRQNYSWAEAAKPLIRVIEKQLNQETMASHS